MRRLFAVLLLLSLLPLPARAAEAPATRGQFLLLLWESLGSVPFDKNAHPFTDLTDQDQAQAAAWAYDEGLILGVGSGLFAPQRPITRTECALLLRRREALLGRDTFLPDGAAACNDYEGVLPWAGDALYWACITGHMPWQEGRLAPEATLTPDQARQLLFPNTDLLWEI